MAVISTIYLVKELADSTFQIPIVGIECRACTGLTGRWRLPSDTIPDPLRPFAGLHLLLGTEGRATAIAVSARLTVVRIVWRDVHSQV